MSFLSLGDSISNGSYERMTMDMNFSPVGPDGKIITPSAKFLEAQKKAKPENLMIRYQREENFVKYCGNPNKKIELLYRDELKKIMAGKEKNTKDYNDLRQGILYLWTLNGTLDKTNMPKKYNNKGKHYKYIAEALNSDDPEKLRECAGYVKALMLALKSINQGKDTLPPNVSKFGNCVYDPNTERRSKAVSKPTTTTGKVSWI